MLELLIAAYTPAGKALTVRVRVTSYTTLASITVTGVLPTLHAAHTDFTWATACLAHPIEDALLSSSGESLDHYIVLPPAPTPADTTINVTITAAAPANPPDPSKASTTQSTNVASLTKT